MIKLGFVYSSLIVFRLWDLVLILGKTRMHDILNVSECECCWDQIVTIHDEPTVKLQSFVECFKSVKFSYLTIYDDIWHRGLVNEKVLQKLSFRFDIPLFCIEF